MVTRSPLIGVGVLLVFLGSALALAGIARLTGWGLVTIGSVLLVGGIIIFHKKNAEVRVSHVQGQGNPRINAV